MADEQLRPQLTPDATQVHHVRAGRTNPQGEPCVSLHLHDGDFAGFWIMMDLEMTKDIIADLTKLVAELSQ